MITRTIVSWPDWAALVVRFLRRNAVIDTLMTDISEDPPSEVAANAVVSAIAADRTLKCVIIDGAQTSHLLHWLSP